MTIEETLLCKPCLTIPEASLLLKWSESTIRRRIQDNTIKTLPRISNKHKILISTRSIKKYLGIVD